MINSNPETVSTDFDASSRLYFEPLDPESVRSVIDAESPDQTDLLPAVVAYGGQTPLNLAATLAAGGVRLLGSISRRSTRPRSGRGSRPCWTASASRSQRAGWPTASRSAHPRGSIGYPVIVRPSFVIGGLAIDSATAEDLARSSRRRRTWTGSAVRIDRYLEGVEVDVDAISDGMLVLIPGLLEHVELAGVHSGDSVGMFPPQTVSEGDQALSSTTMERIVLALGANGPRECPVHRP